MTAIVSSRRVAPAVVVLDQWKDAQRRGFCIWTPPQVNLPSVSSLEGGEEDVAKATAMAAVGGDDDKPRRRTGKEGQTIEDDERDASKFDHRVTAHSIATNSDETTCSNLIPAQHSSSALLRSPDPSQHSSSALRVTTLTSLPTEILSQILSLALSNTPAYKLTRHLERYALINRRFAQLAQANLFRAPFVAGRRGALALGKVDKKLLGHVRELTVEDGGESGWGMEELKEVMQGCKGLTGLRLRGVTLDAGMFDLTRIAELELIQVDLTFASEATSTSPLPSLLHLTLHDVTSIQPSAFPSLPSLHSLSYNHELPSSSPLLFTHLTRSIISLQSLSIRHLYPATQFVDYLSPPSPTSKISPTTPNLLTAAGGAIEDEQVPSLARLTNLKSLTLWSDSSHRAQMYFPLLETIASSNPDDEIDQAGKDRSTGTTAVSVNLHELIVKVDWGYRDRMQEIDGIERELCARLKEEVGETLTGLKRLVLPREFERRIKVLREVMRGRKLDFA